MTPPRHNLHNPDLMVEYYNLMIPLSASYAGLDEVDLLDGDIIGIAFLEEQQIKECIGKMKPETLIRRLSPYL